MAYGKEGHCDIVERNCAGAMQLGDWISQSDKFKLLAPVRMNVVCFTLNQKELTMSDIHKYLAAVRDDGRVFFTPTVYKGVPGIRAAISNWQTIKEDIEIAIEVLSKL